MFPLLLGDVFVELFGFAEEKNDEALGSRNSERIKGFLGFGPLNG
jgi:hypothetical protein